MNNNEILNQIIQILLPILATFLTGVCTYVANRLKNVLEEKTNTQIAKTVVEDAVKFVEQVYTDLHGQEKLEKATEQITEEDENIMIEAYKKYGSFNKIHTLYGYHKATIKKCLIKYNMYKPKK